MRFQAGGGEYKVSGDLFVLGANATQSPAILLRSDLGGGMTGLGLHESYGAGFEVMRHHRLRNLAIVGTSTFASCSCANPSLTAAALSLRAAEALS